MTRFLLTAILASATPVAAVNLVIDYSYDTQNFFGAGNPDGAAAGAQARARLEEAAAFFSAILDDDLDAYATPDPYESSVFTGVATWNWTASFTHPGTGGPVQLNGPTIAANEYRIYAGGRSIGNLGIGGPGGWGWGTGGNGGFFTSEEINEINAITDDFVPLIERRNEPLNDFASWGGSITFDNDGSSNWHYGADDDLAFNESDFLSVALHELGHAIGFGTSDEFAALRSGSFFNGAASRAANGGTNPRLDPTGGHWQDGIDSTIYGTSIVQETAMDPIITSGNRKVITTLDAAALEDIGWEVIALPGLDGDYNADGVVDAVDYVVWRDARDGGGPSVGTYTEWSNNFGATSNSAAASIPEPATVVMLLVGALAACRHR